MCCDVTPLGASSQGLLSDRGGISGIVLSLSGRARSSPPPLRARFYIFYLSYLGIRSGSLSGRQIEDVYSERINNQDLGITSEDMPGSAAACPQSPAPSSGIRIVEAQPLHSSESGASNSTQPPGSQNLRISPCRGTEGGFSGAKEDRGRMRALASRADPTPSSKS